MLKNIQLKLKKKKEELCTHKTIKYKPFSRFKKYIALDLKNEKKSQIKKNKVKNEYIDYKKLMNDLKENIYHQIMNNGKKEDERFLDKIFSHSFRNPVLVNKKIKKENKIKTIIKIKNSEGKIIYENKDDSSNKEKLKDEKPKIEEKNEFQKYKLAKEKWKKFRENLEKINGINLFKTIGAIIKVKILLDKKGNGITASIEEQKYLYEVLEKNENIYYFLNGKEDEEEEEEEEKKEEIEKEDENLIFLDVNPRNLTLDELVKNLNAISEILKDKNLKEKNKEKIEQLYDLYIEQKNIIIEQNSNKAREEFKSNFKNSIIKYIKEDEDDLKDAQKKEREKMEKEINKKINEEINEKKTKCENWKKKKEEEEKNKEKNKEKDYYNVQNQSIANKNPNIRFYNQKIRDINQWEDDIFLPEINSLCPHDGKNWITNKFVKKEYLRTWNNIEWTRIEKIKKFKNYELFIEGATAQDIKQGNIGDCYFLSSLGALCNFQGYIENIFYTDNTKKNLYGIYFFINGKWKLVLVDDYFPCKLNDNSIYEFCFSCSFQNELWVSLIEKAWAKINGCYANIDYGGYSYEAFDVLTEALTQHIYINENKKKELWETIKEANDRHYIMAAGTKPGFLMNWWVGLIESHAYTIIGIKDLNHNNKNLRLIKLRNPWGEKEFNGDWSDKSNKWTTEIKKICEFEGEKDDGIFYMSFDDFVKYFLIIDIAQIEKNYQTSFCKINKNESEKCQIIKLEVKETFPRTFIQLYQKNIRIIKKDNEYFEDNVMGFIMLAKKKDKNSMEYIKSVADKKAHFGLEVEKLEKGTYYIFCDVFYRYADFNNSSYGYTLTCYHMRTQNPLILENITEKEEEEGKKVDIRKYMELSISDYCKNKIKEIEKNKKNKKNENEIEVISNNNNGLIIYKSDNKIDFPFNIHYFVNKNEKPIIVRTLINFKSEKNFCIYNDRIANEFDTFTFKKVEKDSPKTLLVYRYNNESKIEIKNEVVEPPKEIEYEDLYLYYHPIFKKGIKREYKQNQLFWYSSPANSDWGYIIGFENISDDCFKLELKIKEGYIIDLNKDIYEKNEIIFKIEKKKKKVFNIKTKKYKNNKIIPNLELTLLK